MFLECLRLLSPGKYSSADASYSNHNQLKNMRRGAIQPRAAFCSRKKPSSALALLRNIAEGP
jgi:hypothetical protein